VPPISAAKLFSALFGLPLVGLPSAGSLLAVEIPLDSSNLSLSCSAWDLVGQRH
jgi:hypothetical protein